MDSFNSSNSLYIIGKEIGEQGTPHLQGYVEFKDKLRITALKKINNRAHWEKCKGSKDSNLKYCGKDNNYVTNMKIKKPLKILDESKLYEWQKTIIEIIKQEPDDRKIYWIWERKVVLERQHFVNIYHINLVLFLLKEKKNDILYCASEYESDIYVMDLEIDGRIRIVWCD